MGLVSELRRRNVLRMVVLYAVAAWLIMQVAGVLIDLGSLPDWIGPIILPLLALGFPIALIVSWFYELTPEGISLEKDVKPNESTTHVTGRRMDFIVISLLAAAVILFAYDKWWIAPPPEFSIAVLPFENMSDDPVQEYFSDGISEDILNLLVKVPEMQVTSRSSAFSFKGQNVDVPTIAAKLNVAHVLEGSIRKSGNQLRITAQLIEVGTDTHLWSETYDRDLKNVFAIQDEIASAVVDALQITMLGEKPKSDETNPEAYALYLQGHHIWEQAGRSEAMDVEALLKRALEIDPDLAPAWTELGYVYRVQATSGLRPVDEGIELARHAIQRALEIDPRNGRAYAALAYIELELGWNFIAADQYMQRAMVLSPGDSRVLLVAGLLKEVFGRLDEAIDLQERAIALDPVVPRKYLAMGLLYYRAHRFDEAIDSFQTAASLNPGRNVRDYGHYGLALVRLAQGNALAALEETERASGDYKVFLTAIVQHALGYTEASNAAIQELTENRGTPDAYVIAEAYAFRGEIDQAFAWLDVAFDDHHPELIQMRFDPLLANLQDDSRWERLVDKIGLPQQ